MVAANESTPLVPEAEETVETPHENSGHKDLILFYSCPKYCLDEMS